MKASLPIQRVEEYLQKEILKILKKENDIPEKHTILGTDINEIRHIFYYLKSNKIPVNVEYLIDQYTAFVVDIYDIFIKFHILGFEESSFRRLKIAFNFLNTYYQFEVNIYKVEKEFVYIYAPNTIQYTSKRKFPRFYPDNLYAKLNVIFNNLFTHREYEQIFFQLYPKIIIEFQQEVPNLNIILRTLLNDLEKITPDFTIKILNLKEIKKTENWLVRQMLSIKNSIYIENTDNLSSYFHPIPSSILTNFERLQKNMLKTQNEEDVIKFFEEIQKRDIRDQKNSYVISPIIFFDEIIGYIYLETSYVERKRIFFDDAIKVAIISKILGYTLERILFYNSYYLEAKTLVKNISISGILLKLDSKKIFEFLINNDQLKIELELENKTAGFLGFITRMFTTKENEYNIALEFYDFLDESFQLLENYIFKLQMKDKKGGISPIATEFRE